MKLLENHDPQTMLRNREVELRHIGAMIEQLSIGGDLRGKTVTLSGSDYSDHKLGEVHDLLLEKYREGKSIDSSILIDEISAKAKDLWTSPWHGFTETEVSVIVIDCIRHGSSIRLDQYAEIILTYSERRRAYEAARELAKCALNSNGENLIPQASLILESLINGRVTNTVKFQNATEIAALRENGTLPNSAMIVEGLIPAEGITLFGGETSSGKTYSALDVAVGVATEGNVWGREVLIAGPVLYFGKDTSYSMLCNRLLDLCRGRGINFPRNVLIARGEVDDELNISNSSSIHQIQNAIMKTNAVLVIIDDLSSYAPGVDLNSSGQISQVMHNLRNLTRKTGVAILVLTLLNKKHSRNRGQMLSRIGGSVHIPGKVDLAFVFTRKGFGAATLRTITNVKNRITEEPYAVTFTIENAPHGGTILQFGNAEVSSPRTTLVDEWVNVISTILEESTDRIWDRTELVEEAKVIGLGGCDRTIKSAWKLIDTIPSIERTKQGRKYRYQWIGVQGETH